VPSISKRWRPTPTANLSGQAESGEAEWDAFRYPVFSAIVSALAAASTSVFMWLALVTTGVLERAGESPGDREVRRARQCVDRVEFLFELKMR